MPLRPRYACTDELLPLRRAVCCHHFTRDAREINSQFFSSLTTLRAGILFILRLTARRGQCYTQPLPFSPPALHHGRCLIPTPLRLIPALRTTNCAKALNGALAAWLTARHHTRQHRRRRRSSSPARAQASAVAGLSRLCCPRRGRRDSASMGLHDARIATHAVWRDTSRSRRTYLPVT